MTRLVDFPADTLAPADDLAPGPMNDLGLGVSSLLTATLTVAEHANGTLTIADRVNGTLYVADIIAT